MKKLTLDKNGVEFQKGPFSKGWIIMYAFTIKDNKVTLTGRTKMVDRHTRSNLIEFYHNDIKIYRLDNGNGYYYSSRRTIGQLTKRK